MDIGLYVEYDGKKNIVISNGEISEYPIGGMACEFARLHPTEIKNYIMNVSVFKETDLKEYAAVALMELFNAMKERMGVVVATMIVTEFHYYIGDFIRASDKELQELLAADNAISPENEIKKFILKDSGFDEFGASNVGQALLSAYNTFAKTFACYMVSFNLLANDGSEDKTRVDTFLSMYSNNVEFQHFDFSIMLYEGAFHSIYTIKTALSLILFEAAHVMETETKIVKCKNCGQFFVPVGRSDQVYCGYPSPQDLNKVCRDIGAQNTIKRKRKNDIVVAEYRRIYMRYKMALIRHPENAELKKQFEQLTKEMKIKREQRERGEISSDDILVWLSGFDNR